ncbi:sugar phosphate isomerase/epimerase [Vibrio sp. EA2]|uniref:sugar phosphate isomerase/epimerase family protein n=1 Tax=Vibrio sp. EA2 TaxID=3079860 RepID=UPI002949669F|nr:sugar phosphate isomerase/epimerase [Vibrio sp. EA2]MDV6252963.1 sugar phosphate isomerase/epimerase [Vibrio sp. EA2]
MKLKNWVKTGALTLGLLSSSLVMAHAKHQDDIALQMYTLRDVGTLEEQFSLAQKTGFHAVELVGTQGVDSFELNRLLDLYQLDAMGAHVQLSALRNDLNTVISFNQSIDNQVIIMPWLAAEDRPTSAQGWKALGQELDAIGKTLRENGMQLAYHNHDFEMKKYEGKLALEWILEGSHADNLKLELDAAWVSRGGQDPAKLIKKWKKRIFSIHAKDNSGIGTHDNERNFTVIGDGIMAWDEVLPVAQKANVQWYVVEHDMPADAEAIISKANQYLTEHLDQGH